MKKNILIKISLFVLIAFQLALVGYSFKKNIPFEIQSLLAKDNPVRIQYEKDLKNFNDESTNWILIERENPFTVGEVAEVSQKIGRFLEMNYGIESIIGPHNAKFFTYDAQGFLLSPFIKDGAWTEGALQELQDPLWKNQLIHEDLKAFLISFKTTSLLPRKEEQPVLKKVLADLDFIKDKYPGVTTSILGAKSASAYFLEEMQFQQRVITPLLLLAIIVFFYLCFRSWQIILWSLFTLFITYTSTLVAIIFVEGGLGPYSTFALMFCFIVATTDVIHFFGRFQQLSGPIEQRLQETIRIAWLPCLLTSLTTAAGFFALIVNQNLPVRYFGLYCAFGCMLEWAVIFYLLPPLLRAFHFDSQVQPFDSVGLSQKLDDLLGKYKKWIVPATFVSLLFGFYFTTWLKIDDNFYTKFEKSHPLSESLEHFSRSFDFVGSINMIIQPTKAPDSLYNNQLLSDFRRIEDEIQKHSEVSRLSSLSQIYGNLDGKVHKILKNEAAVQDEKQSLLHLLNNYGVIGDFYNEVTGEYRTTIYLRSLSTESLNSVLKLVDEIAVKEKNSYTIRPSGFSVIRSYINGRVIHDFFESFFISFFLIFLCYLWLYRSIKWSLIALIPNLVPLIAVSGLMGLFQVPVDTNLVILTCVAFGISGDNTVHLSYVIQQEQRRGRSYKEAIRYAFKLIGIAMIATSGIFIFCLPVFLLGTLRLFDHIAIFLSAAFIFAFIADVFMFPALQAKYGWSFNPMTKKETE